MRLSLSDLHRISQWFEVASQYEDLKDDDLIIHDKITEYLEEKGIIGEPDDIINYLDEDLNEDNDDEDEKDYDKLNFYGDEDEDEEDNY